MTENAYNAARPSEGAGKTHSTVTFWAQLWRPMAHNSHGEALVSPYFGTESDAVGWVRAHRADFETVELFRRTTRGGDFEDQRLRADDAPMADPARLAALLADLRLRLMVRS